MGARETGTAGLTGSHYVIRQATPVSPSSAPRAKRALAVETGQSDRLDNMRVFSVRALELLERNPG
jgi:hypothetical protein